MSKKLDIDLNGSSINIVRKCRNALSDILQSKYGCVVTVDGVDFEDEPSFAHQHVSPVTPEKRCDFMLPTGVKVSVWKADLSNFTVDAVVNAANEYLSHGAGLAYALSKAGGPEIQRQCDDLIRKCGQLSTGQSVVSTAGSLPCKMIIHAVGPQLYSSPSQSEINNAEPLLRRTIWGILEKVKENGLENVAIPAISSGLFNFPLPLCAETIVTAILKRCSRPSSHLPKEIMLVNHDERTVKEMEKACHNILGASMPKTYSQAAKSKGGGDSKWKYTIKIKNVELTLKKGHIEEQKTDVIVNTTYDRDLEKGEISRAISARAGPEMQREMKHAPQNGLLIITKSHRLQCKEVYHTSFSQAGDAAEEILFKSVGECLHLAAKNNRTTISFPAIGTGGLSLSKSTVAQIMSSVVSTFAVSTQKKMKVFFVIFPSDVDTYMAFEDMMRCLEQQLSQGNFKPVLEYKVEFRDSRKSMPKITLDGPSDAATREAELWLLSLLFWNRSSFDICNNLILHLGVQEFQQLSYLERSGLLIEESFDRGRAHITVHGEQTEDIICAVLKVEAILCEVQRRFIKEEEDCMVQMFGQKLCLERMTMDYSSPDFTHIYSDFQHTGLRIVKVDKVKNNVLEVFFDQKKKQIGCQTPRRMFQCVPAQFCELISHVGFHTECAPPDDPIYGDGIYFASTVKKALQVWKRPDQTYLHFVEAEVLTGHSTNGAPGLILPPVRQTSPHTMYDSVGDHELSVVFSGFQALPTYIITCKSYP